MTVFLHRNKKHSYRQGPTQCCNQNNSNKYKGQGQAPQERIMVQRQTTLSGQLYRNQPGHSLLNILLLGSNYPHLPKHRQVNMLSVYKTRHHSGPHVRGELV